MTDLPRLFTPAEVGAALGGISADRVLDLVVDGSLHARKRGARYFFSAEDVQHYIDRMPGAGTAETSTPHTPAVATIVPSSFLERKRKRA